jgi:hypothetical protein
MISELPASLARTGLADAAEVDMRASLTWLQDGFCVVDILSGRIDHNQADAGAVYVRMIA